MENQSILDQFKDVVNKVYKKFCLRDSVINGDDITNLKIQLGLYSDDSLKFIDSLNRGEL